MMIRMHLPAVCRMALLLMLGLAAPTPALAHHAAGGSTAGLPIPSLTHGDMRVVATHRAAVLALADAQARTDPVFRRLRNFIALQHAFCFWSLMPGSITDEASPFNECTHADLAAVQALLRHMTEMPAAHTPGLALAARIEADEHRAADAPILCQFSDEPFNTAALIEPRWGAVPGHLPTLLVLGAALAFAAAAGAALWAGATPGKPSSA